MNHSFQIGTVNKSDCGKCGRKFIDHTTQATCESCGDKGKCELVGTILMCGHCEMLEKEAFASAANVADKIESNRDRIVELLNALDKEIPLDSRAYFNVELTSIVDIENKLAEEMPEAGADAIHFKLAEIVNNRLNKFKRNLFEVKQMELELKVNMVADQRYLNQLVPKLREEERAKFKDYDITYKPPVAAPTSKPSGPRMSAQDKAIESFAKMMNISVEQARVALNKGIATTIKCTCSETPGLCKVHPKTN